MPEGTRAIPSPGEPEDFVELEGASSFERETLRRRVLRDRPAMASFMLLGLIVLACILAPLYSAWIADTGPDTNHAGETITVNGREVDVVSTGGITEQNGELELETGGEPLGPQWFAAGGRFMLGADPNGRDVAVRLLYGGRTTLLVAFGSAFASIVSGMVLALLAGFYRGWVDTAVSWIFDVIWAFPVILLGIALGTALAVDGFHHGPINIDAGSLWIPIFVIALVMIPYVGRVFRAEVLSLRQREFVEAALAEGAGARRVMFSELLPNVRATGFALLPLLVATNVVLEAGLSFLGAGVQDPTPSWGKMIAEGEGLITTAPTLAIIPGVAIFLTVLGLNLFGERLRVILNPRSRE